MTVMFSELTAEAQDQLGQLFLIGPVWNSHLLSRSGYDELEKYGLAERGYDWQWLTRAGVGMASGANLDNLHNNAMPTRTKRWRKKQNHSLTTA